MPSRMSDSPSPPGRKRRSNSVTIAQANRQEKTQRTYQPDRPCHANRDSLFASSSGYTNYRGILNLALILLALATSRVALENVLKYGILVDPLSIVNALLARNTVLMLAMIGVSLNGFILASLVIERKLIARRWAKKWDWLRLQVANLTSVLVFPIIMIYLVPINPVLSSIACTIYVIVFFKLISYHMVNYWCRRDRERTSANHVGSSHRQHHQRTRSNDQIANGKLVVGTQYPDNLTHKDIYYFMVAPTLCYELDFPRSDRIRKRFLFKRIVEIMLILQLNMALIQQWMVPTIHNSLQPLQEMNYFKVLERLLKLALPNFVIWLIWFYWLFHSCLNAFAEILRFGDRQFYLDWWNSESVDYFWKNWNIPAHQWAVRHLFKPMISHGFTRFQASVAVFIVSAFFHEYLVSVPLKMFGYFAFLGMIAQIPFAWLVNRYLSGHWANTAVWISLIIGQPLCILACYHDYYVIHHIKK